MISRDLRRIWPSLTLRQKAGFIAVDAFIRVMDAVIAVFPAVLLIGMALLAEECTR